MLEEVKQRVAEILGQDDSGHGMAHIDRVVDLSLEFAEKEGANKEVVTLIALLHDVDDHKLFGAKQAEELTNAKKIMQECGVVAKIQAQVLGELGKIGYSKRLKGLQPETIEGKIVSDADMCDALGANGVLRVYAYGAKQGRPFFDRKAVPVYEMDAQTYIKNGSGSGVCHMFEKILKLKDLMLTEAGKVEAQDRHQIVVEFLRHLFVEERAPEWLDVLERYVIVGKISPTGTK